jgi:hypothetical protein
MFESNAKADLLTESEKRELMLGIEELAQIEGLRNYARLGSELGISTETQILIDNKADKTEVIKHDDSSIGFFGVISVVRQSALSSQLTAITCSNPNTPNYVITDPINTNAYGFSTADEFKTVMSVIVNLQTRLAELETKLKNYGLLQ